MSSAQDENDDHEYDSLPAELYETLGENLQTVMEAMGGSKDVIARKFCFAESGQKGALLFIDGLVNQLVVNANIIEPLMYKSCFVAARNGKDSFSVQAVQESMVAVGEVEAVGDFAGVIDGCLSGDSVLLIDGYK